METRDLRNARTLKFKIVLVARLEIRLPTGALQRIRVSNFTKFICQLNIAACLSTLDTLVYFYIGKPLCLSMLLRIFYLIFNLFCLLFGDYFYLQTKSGLENVELTT